MNGIFVGNTSVFSRFFRAILAVLLIFTLCPAMAFAQEAEPSGSENDSEQTLFVASVDSPSAKPGETITVAFSGAQTGAFHYVSAILVPEGTTTPTWYGKLSQSAEGVANLTLPEDIALGAYTLVVFNECISTEDEEVDVPYDLASEPVELTLVVEAGEDFLDELASGSEAAAQEGDWIYEQTSPTSATLVGYVGTETDFTLPETVGGNSLNVTAVNIQTSTAGVISVDAFDHQGLTSFAAPAWTDLETLNVGFTDRTNSSLSYLDVSANTKLTDLNCQNNWLTSLDLQANTQLEVLLCGGNDLATLDVSALKGLQEFSCYNNLLSSLDVSQNTALSTLMCAENNLGALNLSTNTELTALNCSTNAITSLVLPSPYKSDIALNCVGNRLLEVSGFIGTTGNLYAYNQNPLITMKREGNLWVSDSGLLQDSSVWADRSGASAVISYNWARQRFEIAASAVTDAQLARTFSTSYSGQDPALEMVAGVTSFLFIEGGGSIITPESWLAELDTAAGTATIVGYMGQLFEHKDNPLLQTPAALGSAIVHEGSSYAITAIDIRTSMQGVNRFDYEATTSLTSFAAPAWEDLDTLVLDDNFSLTQVDVSENALLKVLSCNNSGLKQLVLPEAPSSLQTILVEDNQLEQLDLSAYSLDGFNVSSNQLVSLLLPANSANIPGAQISYEANKLLSTTGGNGLPSSVALAKQTPSVMLYQEGDTWVSASGLVGADTVTLDDEDKDISYNPANKRFELLVADNPTGSAFANSFATTYESLSATTAQGTISFEFIGTGNSLVQDDWVYQLDAPAVGEATVIGYLGNKTKVTNDRSDTAGDPAYLDATVTPAGSATTYAITALKMTDPALTPLASITEFLYRGTGEEDRVKLTSVNLSACTNLSELDCSYGNVTNLDVSKNYQLLGLCCGYNNLSQLDVSANTQLVDLWCYENALDQLDVSCNRELVILDCYGNNLTELDVSQNHALGILECSDNQLSQLIVAGNTALHDLRCWGNDLTTLDLTAHAHLAVLQCGINYYLSDLRLPKSTDELKYLSCGSTSLSSLDVSAYQNLISLTCGDALLTSLSVPQTATLTEVFCSDNQLEQLDLSGCSNLDELYCADNQLVSLKVDGAAPLNVYEVRNNRLIDVSGFATAKDPSAIWAFGGQAVELAMYLDAATQCWVSVQQFSLDASTSITFDGNVAYYDDTLKRFAVPMANVGADQETLLTSFSAFYNAGPSESYEFLAGDVTFTFDVVELADGWQYQVTSAASGTAPGTATVVGYVGTTDNPGNNPLTQENFANPVNIDGFEYEITAVNIVNSPNFAVTSYTRSGVSPDPGTITAFAAPAWTELEHLSFTDFNQLESFDVSQNTELITLDCVHNKLSSLDVSGLNSLTGLSSDNNALLDVKGIENTAVSSSVGSSQSPDAITMIYDQSSGVYVSVEADLLSASRSFTFTADDPNEGAITWNANTRRFEARGDVVWPPSGIAGDFVTKFTSVRSAASGKLTFMFEPATVDTLVASPPTLEHLGGKVDVTLTGTSLADLTTRVKAVSDAGDEQAVRLSGNLTEKSGSITIPENTSDQTITWTFMVSLDGGITWEQLTATVTVSPGLAPSYADPNLNTFTVQGGLTQTAGQEFSLLAVGDRQSEPGRVPGDTIYMPVLASANPTVSFSASEPYIARMTIHNPGTYTLEVTFEHREWDGATWRATGNNSTLSAQLTITAAKPSPATAIPSTGDTLLGVAVFILAGVLAALVLTFSRRTRKTDDLSNTYH